MIIKTKTNCIQRNSFSSMELNLFDSSNNQPIYKILFPTKISQSNDVYFNVIIYIIEQLITFDFLFNYV